jgi:hypothetical protein
MTEVYSAVTSEPDSESWKYDGNDGGDEQAFISVCCGLVAIDEKSGLVRLVRESNLQSERRILD